MKIYYSALFSTSHCRLKINLIHSISSVNIKPFAITYLQTHFLHGIGTYKTRMIGQFLSWWACSLRVLFIQGVLFTCDTQVTINISLWCKKTDAIRKHTKNAVIIWKVEIWWMTSQTGRQFLIFFFLLSEMFVQKVTGIHYTQWTSSEVENHIFKPQLTS